MAKKAPAKPPAKRKPRPKKPVVPAVPVTDPTDYGTPIEFPAWQSVFLQVLPCLLAFVFGAGAGIWGAGGIDVSPSPTKPDAVSAVYDTQEIAFRRLSGERAKALRAGEIKSESESAAWMSSRFIPKAEAAWIVLLTEEAKAFGGEQWTAEKEAAWIERYVR
jgi:hypothetical protein